MHILIVDDDLAARELLRYLLCDAGHEVRVAGDGEAALRAAHDYAFDVAILDIDLPGMSGWAVARQLRRSTHDPMRLVALTGRGTPRDRDLSSQAGFDVHLVKPARASDIAMSLLEPCQP